MSSNKERILVFFIGVIGSVFFLELALQGYGIFYRLSRYYYKIAPISKKDDKYVILCLGNSYTAGAGAPKGEGYPDHLQRIFNNKAKEKNVLVVNKGKGAMNSGEVLDALGKNIFQLRPELIILQVGTPNIRKLNKYSSYLKRAHLLKNQNPLYISRLFRLSVIITNSAKKKLYRGPSRPPPRLEQQQLESYRNRWKRLARKLVLMLDNIENYSDVLYTRNNVKKEDIYKWVESDVREIVRLAKMREVKVLVLSYPLPLQTEIFEPFLHPDDPIRRDALENVEAVNSILYQVAEEEKMELMDIAGLFETQPEIAAGDQKHPNSKGYEIIAQSLYERISEKMWFE